MAAGQAPFIHLCLPHCLVPTTQHKVFCSWKVNIETNTTLEINYNPIKCKQNKMKLLATCIIPADLQEWRPPLAPVPGTVMAHHLLAL